MQDIWQKQQQLPHFLVAESRLAGREIIQAAVDFCNLMTDNGLYTSHELPVIARQAYLVDYYLAQVNNGGHRQYLANLKAGVGGANAVFEENLGAVAAGLAAMGASANHELYRRFLALFEGSPERRDRLAVAFPSEPDADAEALDSEFYALGDAIDTHSAAALRASPRLRVVADTAFDGEVEALIAGNPLRAARKAKRDADVEASRARDPMWVCARRLCFEAGLAHQGFTAGHPVNGGMLWGVVTDRGVCRMLIAEDFAVLMAAGTELAPENMIARIELEGGMPRRDPPKRPPGLLDRMFGRRRP